MLNKPSYGICVGRFQVNDLHEGHMELFRQISARHNGVIVFVGKAPAGLTQDNPLTFEARRAMINAKFPNFTVLPLMDTKTDEQWSADLDTAIKSVVDFGDVTLYGGSDSFVPHYSGQYKPVELALPTQSVSGTDIRKDVSNKVIESSEFRAGMIYALHHLWPVLLPCVDIAIFNQDYTQVLLGRKPGEKEFRFVGGHAEKKHGSYEIGARYEVLEEATVEPGAMQYIGSAVIDDWRYRTVDRGIMTAFFATTVSNQASHPNDDIVETRWFDVDKLKQSDFVDTHHILYKMMMAWLVKRSVKENYGTAKA